MNQTCQSGENDSIGDMREPVIKMSTMGRIRIIKQPKCRSKLIIMALCSCVVIVAVIILAFFQAESSEIEEEKNYSVYGDFLIDGPNCKIPNLNPFADEAMKIFKRVKYVPCSDKRPLTSVEQNFETDEALLMIHEDRKKDYLSWWHSDITCCYQQITRSGVNASADNEFILTPCKTFTGNHSLKQEEEFILVKCSGFLWVISSEVYKNGHALIRTKKNVEKKFQEKSSKDKINVFLMGIDSISRLNLIRAMPETYNHLHRNDDWFELRGYNKIGDNTLPNLLAIFTGKSEGVIRKECNWSIVGELDKCRFIWNDYSDSGYATAYAEDESSINTFNYHKPGFVKPPTDYYLRPFNLAIEENLKIRTVINRRMCVGYQNYADYIYNYGFDYAEKYSNNSYLGFFWTNSFSHEDLSMISEMDGRVKNYLEQLETRGILNSSIVIFFSDHGMRFGPIRNLFIGWLEERLPFFYIWLPPKFRESNPDIVEALRINRDRLSSPYDVHVTLKHILKMSGGFEGELSAVSCPKCQSLFSELPLNRSCADAGIDQHWCTCVNFQVIDETSKVVQSAVQQIISEVNKNLAPHPKCAKLKLKKVHSARKSAYKSSTNYLISFNVSPSDAQLEATIRCDDESCEYYKFIGSVSRLNRYGDQSICVNDSELRKYCYCL